MKPVFARCLSAALVVSVVPALAPVADASVIPTDTITATTDSERYAEHQAMFAVDRSMLTGEYPDELHGTPHYGAWLGAQYNGGFPTWLRVDLGAIFELVTMRVWNGSGGSRDRSARRVDIYYSTDSTAPGGDFGDAKWALLGQYEFVAHGPGYTEPFPVNNEISMSNVSARVIGLNVLSNWGDAYGPAISELQFVVPDATATHGVLLFVR